MRLATSSCNPACQERRSITHALLRAAVPMRLCVTARQERHTKSKSIRAASTVQTRPHKSGARPGKLSTKSAQDCSERSDLHFKMLKRKMRSVKCARYCIVRARFHIRIAKNWSVRSSPATAETETLLRWPQEPNYPKKTQGFVPKNVFTREFTRLWNWYSSLLPHGTFLDMIMTWWQDCPWTFVRNLEDFELNFLWLYISISISISNYLYIYISLSLYIYIYATIRGNQAGGFRVGFD